MKNIVLAMLVFCGLSAVAVDLVIQPLSNDGQIVFNEVPDVTTYRIEHRSSLMDAWGPVTNLSPTGAGSITSPVPISASAMFFRVVGEFAPVPEGMVEIPAGTNSGTDPDYGPYSQTVERFYMDAMEVTLLDWVTVRNWTINNGNAYDLDNVESKGTLHPAHSMNWYDAVKWCNARSEMEGRTPCYTVGGSVFRTGQAVPDCDFDANGFRLPTPDEWEYAARGGLQDKRFPWGDTITHHDANYDSDPAYDYDVSTTRGPHPDYYDGDFPTTCPVDTFSANEYGLYCMSGNIREWVWQNSSTYGLTKGGSWGDEADHLRCRQGWYYQANNANHFTGFRTVCR